MKNFPTQAQYLRSNGITEDSPQTVIVHAKKKYRRLYLKTYRLRRKPSRRAITIRPTLHEYMRLQEQKQQHGMSSLSRFIVQSSLAYLDQQYLAHDPHLQINLLKALQKTGTNINQIVQKLHRQLRIKTMKGQWDDSVNNMAKIMVGYELMSEQVDDLRTQVHLYTNSPPPHINELAWEAIRDDRTKIKQLIVFLLEHVAKIPSSPIP